MHFSKIVRTRTYGYKDSIKPLQSVRFSINIVPVTSSSITETIAQFRTDHSSVGDWLVAFLLVAPSVIWQESLVINDYIGLFHALYLFTHPVFCTEKNKDTVLLLKALHAHCRSTCNFMLVPSNLYLLYPCSVSLDSTVTEKGIVI